LRPPADSPQQTHPAVPEALSYVEELLDDLLGALLDLPGDGWSDLAAAFPDELFDRLDRYIESRLFEPAAG
jgi:hypothetical protein